MCFVFLVCFGFGLVFVCLLQHRLSLILCSLNCGFSVVLCLVFGVLNLWF